MEMFLYEKQINNIARANKKTSALWLNIQFFFINVMDILVEAAAFAVVDLWSASYNCP